jgi:hypothetical protein
MRKLQQHLGRSSGDIMTTENDARQFPSVRPVLGELLDVPAWLRVDIEMLLYGHAPSNPSEWNLEIELRLATSSRVELFLQECLMAVAQYQHTVDGLLDHPTT